MARKSKDKKNKEEQLSDRKPERGAESLFRTASRNHMELSGMADNKAHILLNINSIIISIVLTVLTHRLATDHYLILPTAILLSVCLASIVFAILTTRPHIGKGIFTEEQVANKEANLFFFGNFHQMDLVTYQQSMAKISYDKEYLHKSITSDIFHLGKALAKKYRYLNIGYKIFMFGIILAVLSFAVSLVFGNNILLF